MILSPNDVSAAYGTETKVAEPVVLKFTQSSTYNTTLSTSDDRLYFEVITPFWLSEKRFGHYVKRLTKIKQLDPDTMKMRCIAEIEMTRKVTDSFRSTPLSASSDGTGRGNKPPLHVAIPKLPFRNASSNPGDIQPLSPNTPTSPSILEIPPPSPQNVSADRRETRTQRIQSEKQRIHGGWGAHWSFRVRFAKAASGSLEEKTEDSENEFDDWMDGDQFLSLDWFSSVHASPQANASRHSIQLKRKTVVVHPDIPRSVGKPGTDASQPLLSYRPHRRYFLILKMYKHASLSLHLNPTSSKSSDGMQRDQRVVRSQLWAKVLVSYILLERRRQQKNRWFGYRVGRYLGIV